MKGIISISMLLLSLALLFLTSSIAQYNNRLGVVNAAGNSLEAASADADSASYSFKSLLHGLHAIDVSLGGQSYENVTFSADSAGIMAYRTEAGRLRQFLEAYSKPGNLTLNMSEAASPVLYVRPLNISADFTPGYMNFTPQNASPVYGYELQVRIAEPTPGLNWTLLNAVSPSSPDALYAHIAVEGSNGTVSDAVRYLNRSKNSTLLLQTAGGSTAATVYFMPAAKMSLAYSQWVNARTTIMLNATQAAAYGGTSVELGANIINVRMEDGIAINRPVYVDETLLTKAPYDEEIDEGSDD